MLRIHSSSLSFFALLLQSLLCYLPRFFSYQGVKFYISGAKVPGEGELKCIDWLKNMPKPDESAVIVGGDADLILQGLALSEVSAKLPVVRCYSQLFPKVYGLQFKRGMSNDDWIWA